jgi:hypothetical protein
MQKVHSHLQWTVYHALANHVHGTAQRQPGQGLGDNYYYY